MHVYLTKVAAFMYLYIGIFVLYTGMVESRHRQSQSSMKIPGAQHLTKFFAMNCGWKRWFFLYT